MSESMKISVAALFLCVGVAGLPLEPLRILAAIAVCSAVLVSRRFAAALSLVAVILGGWLQHGQFRLGLLAAAALLGIAVRFWGPNPRAATAIMAISAVTATAWLVLG
jgi:hypothetical protein